MDDEQPEPQDKPRSDLSNVRDLPPPAPRPEREITVELLPYDQRTGISAHDRLEARRAERPSTLQTVARTVAGFAVAAAILVGIFLLLSALDDNSSPTAPWASPHAPVVHPDPLRDE